MINKDDLLPCPFCGSKDTLIVKGTEYGENYGKKVFLPPYVTCVMCDITMTGTISMMFVSSTAKIIELSDSDMIHLWNRRYSGDGGTEK